MREEGKDMELFYIDPKLIKLNDDLPRFRSEMGEVRKLAESIQTKGQIQPIVVNRELELICGGRRLAACLLLNKEVLTAYHDATDPFTMRELEIEENIQRKQFTPAEECLAIEELHRMKQSRHGQSSSGRKGGHTLDDTAELIGRTRGNVIEALHLAEALKQFPELQKAKTKSEIKKAAKAAEKVMQRAAAVEKHKEVLANGSSSVQLHLADARDFLKEIPDRSIDIILTDPAFGIEVDSTAQTIGGQCGGFTTAGYSFDDSTERALDLYQILAQHSTRIAKDTAHLFIFVGPEHFWTIRQMFIAAGWLAHVKPIIWIKRTTGQCNVPHAWPASCYEMALYARRQNSRFVKEGMPDWLEHDPVPPSQRIHPTEKPVPVMKNLLSRVALPGMTMLDPFMGSAASIEAGLSESLICQGCDILKESYNAAHDRIARYLEGEKERRRMYGGGDS
jgi:site-specific DNA-methyltransferase (adenine-specific)